jgi:ADP-ribose diphosphatase
MKIRQLPQVKAVHSLAQTRIFHVEQVDLSFANGQERQFERLVQHRAAVMIAPLIDTNTILLAREYAVGTESYELGLPKGIIEHNESVLDAANREMQEEIGYAAGQLRYLRSLATAPGYLTHHIELVLAQDLYPSQLTGDEPEPIEVVPWQLDHLDELFARDDCNEARTIAALFLVREHLLKEEKRR